MLKIKYIAISCLVVLSIIIYAFSILPYGDIENIPKELIVFSEHKTTFSEGHHINILNSRSKKIIHCGIKTHVYGNFDITKNDNVAWLSESTLFLYDPLSRNIVKKKIPKLGIKFEGRDLDISDFSVTSISPNGDMIAYLFPKGTRIYADSVNKNSRSIDSVGLRSELHIFDLRSNTDKLISENAINWGQPRWSPDQRKILYIRPDNDSFFNQDYICKMNIDDVSKIHSSIFIFDFDKDADYKACAGVDAVWNTAGDKIAFITDDSEIGFFDLSSMDISKFTIKIDVNPVAFKMAWSSDQRFVAYLSKPKFAAINALIGMLRGSWHERPSSLWLITTDGVRKWYIQTRNFGDIRFAPKSYESLLVDKKPIYRKAK